MRKKGFWAICFVMVTVLVVWGTAGQVQAADKPEYVWRLVSAEVEGDFMTDWAHEFADRMEEWSDGNIKIEIFPYGTLGAERDIVELCQLGEVEFVMTDYGWISSFVPQAQVLALHYLWPREKSVEVVNEVFINGEIRGALEESFRARNFEPLGYIHEGWQWVTSKKKFRTPEDTEGIKIRVMASPMLIKAYNTYGFDAVSLDYGEIYSALQTNLIDAQVQPMFANYSMGFYEQADYITNMYAEMFMFLPLANKEFFDSLPQEIQDKMLEVWDDLTVPAGEDSLVREQRFIDMVKEKRPNVEFYRFTDEDIVPFRELSRSLHDEYLKIGGDGAEKILETLLADLEKAKAKYGVN